MRLTISILLLLLLGCSSVNYGGREGSELDRFIIKRLEESKKPGFSGVVLEGDKVLWSGNYGYRDIGKKLEVEEDTPFIIASVSKLITATLLMTFVEDGVVDLNEDINNYLDFEVRNPEYPDTPITVKMLLNHSSSISMNFPKIWFTKGKGDSNLDLEYFLYEYLTPGGKYYTKRSFSSFKPGSDFSYSNPGITILAHIVERVTGREFEELSRDRIFNPLNMDSTSWNYSHYKEDEVAKPYSKNLFYTSWGYYNFPIYPAGFLKSTKKDLAKFFNSFFQGGDLLNKSTMDTMFEIQEGIKPLYWDEMGLTWQYKYLEEGYNLVGHSGGLFGISSLAFYHRESNRTIIILMNGSWQTGKSYDRFKDEPIKEIFIKLLEEDFK